MDVARLNFSHGDPSFLATSAARVRDVARTAGRPVGLLADLSGPKIRLGELEDGSLTLEPGAPFALRPGDGPSVGDTNGRARDLCGAGNGPPSRGPGAAGRRGGRAAGRGHGRRRCHGGRAWRNDPFAGGRQRAVRAVDHARAHRQGPRRHSRSRSSSASTTWRSRSCVVREDIKTLRGLLGDQPPPIVAKIETRPAIDDFDAILEVVDAVMIARGDLGVELPYEEVPIIQKQLVRRALDRGVPTIVATQMLESMIEAPRPTRAEASDVANAVFDGADAIMLSGETAIGRYPDPRRRGGRPDRAPVRGEGSRASRAGRRRRVGHRRRRAHVCRRRPGPRGTGPGRDRLLHAERVDGTHARFAATAGAGLRVRPERIGGQPAGPRARRASRDPARRATPRPAASTSSSGCWVRSRSSRRGPRSC